MEEFLLSITIDVFFFILLLSQISNKNLARLPTSALIFNQVADFVFGPLVNEIRFGENPQCPFPRSMNLAGQLDDLMSGNVDVGRNDSQHD